MNVPHNTEADGLRSVQNENSISFRVSKTVSELTQINREGHTSPFEVKQHQLEAWEHLYRHRASGETSALIHMATGLGKTTIVAGDIKTFSEQFVQEQGRAPRVLFMAHQTELLRQAEERCADLIPGLEQATLYAGNGSYDEVQQAGLVFATLQTMNMKKHHFEKGHFDYVVVDESHHSMAPMFEKAIGYFQPAFRLGVTATPFRKDQKDISELFGKIVYSKNLAEAISDQLLDAPDYEVVADDLLIKAIDSDFIRPKELREALFDQERNRVIARIIHEKQMTIDRPRTIVFAQNIAHAEDFSGYVENAVPLHSELSHDERRRIIMAFRAGEIPTIVAVDMLNEGVDIPEANLAVFLRSTASRTIFEQQLGRILRKMSDKDAHVLDFVGTAERLRMIYDLSEEVRKINEEKARALGVNLEGNDIEYSRFGTFSPTFDRYSVDIIEKIKLLTESEQLAPEGWMNVGQIADAVGRSTFYIYSLIQSLELPTRKFRTPMNYTARYLSPAHTKELMEMFLNPEGYVSVSDLEILLGKSNSYVLKYISDRGFETKQFANDAGILVRHISPSDAELAIEEHMATEPPTDWVSVSKVSAERSVNRLTVRRAIKRLGIEAVKFTAKETNQVTLHVKIEDAQMIEDFLEPKGVTRLSDIADRFGTSTQVVKRRAHILDMRIVEKMAPRADGIPIPTDHVSQSDAETLVGYFERRQLESAPDGWEKISDLANEFTITYPAVKAMARKLELVTRQYMPPDGNKRMTYVSAEGAETLRQLYR